MEGAFHDRGWDQFGGSTTELTRCKTTRPTGRRQTHNFRYLHNMTAVRLRGQDAINRALEVHERHTTGMESITALADAYGATERAIYDWLKLAKKHLLPDLDDKVGWFRLIVQDQGARLEEAKDADSVRIAQLLAQLMGVGSAEELKQHMARLETAKVALIASAFDQTIAELPNRKQLRAAFLDAIAAHEPV